VRRVGSPPFPSQTQAAGASSATTLFRRPVEHTLGLVLAEALLPVTLGVVADDLQLLRSPGYLVGLAGALLVTVAGGLPHGRNLARRLEGQPEDDEAAVEERIRRNQTPPLSDQSAFQVLGVGQLVTLDLPPAGG